LPQEKSKETVKARLLKSESDAGHKLIIPDEVEKMIRNYCALSPSKEWSGILFYQYEGDFDNGLTLTCKDILLLDQGGAVATEFDASNPEIARYMFTHKLMNCCIGLIHSHQNFSTFFSGTDTGTLLQEGKDCNNFLSLIVNNAGVYTAAITRKLVNECTIIENTTTKSSYSLFNTGTTIDLPEKVEEKNLTEVEFEVEYFLLEIVKSDGITASPECEAFSKVINKPVEYPKPWSGWNSNDNFSTAKVEGYKKSKKEPSPVLTNDYYGSLFEEYGIERHGYNTGFGAYVAKEDQNQDEDTEIDDICIKIDWDNVVYVSFLEKLFFGTPFITKPKHITACAEMDYIAKGFGNLCSKTFHTVMDMRTWFQSVLDYYLYETDFSALAGGLNKALIQYSGYTIEDIVAYRTAKHIEQLIKDKPANASTAFLNAAKDLLLGRAI